METVHTVRMEGVTKSFGPHVAVADLALEVPRGAVYGLIGPNGSGKTTTMHMIMSIVYPDRGAIEVFDEPMAGLDPVNADLVRDAILELRREGVTTILSTHDMGVAERMCDFICKIFRGRKVLDGTLRSIQERYGADRIRIRVEGSADLLEGLRGVAGVTDHGNAQELRLTGQRDPQQILAEIMSRARVHGFEIARPSLHEIFVDIAGPQAQGGQP